MMIKSMVNIHGTVAAWDATLRLQKFSDSLVIYHDYPKWKGQVMAPVVKGHHH